MPAAERVVCFTEHLAWRLVESGGARSEQVVVVAGGDGECQAG